MRLIIFILVLFFATVLGVIIHKDPGYALFAYRDWTIEMPLWLATVLLFISILLTLFLLWFFYLLFTSGARVKRWWKERRSHRSRQYLAQGLLELAEGRYQKAEKFLSNSAKFSDIPLIHYLSAAKAADENNAPLRRDKYLALAQDISGRKDIAVRLTEAELHFQHKNYDQCVAMLQHLHAEYPKHPLVLKLLANTYVAMGDWHSFYSLLPEVKKSNVFTKEALFALEAQMYQILLPEFNKRDLKYLLNFWKAAPKSIQQDPASIVAYVQVLMEKNAQEEAEEILKRALKNEWDPRLIALYGNVKGSSLYKQLNFAESCLESHPKDPYLYLTLGKLCFAEKLWGKARDYLDASLHLEPMIDAYILLGKVMEQMGNNEKAQEYYKKGLLAFQEKQ